jgi:hypothetical protein
MCVCICVCSSSKVCDRRTKEQRHGWEELALALPFFLTFQDPRITIQGPPVPPGWHCALSSGSSSRTKLGESQSIAEKKQGLLAKAKELLKRLGSRKD